MLSCGNSFVLLTVIVTLKVHSHTALALPLSDGFFNDKMSLLTYSISVSGNINAAE